MISACFIGCDYVVAPEFRSRKVRIFSIKDRGKLVGCLKFKHGVRCQK